MKLVNGEAYLTREDVLKLVETTDPAEIKPGPQRDWFVDFQKRRPLMSEAQAMREVLERIGAPDWTMPGPQVVR